ncbi:HAD-like protein [Aspergillus filifer]
MTQMNGVTCERKTILVDHGCLLVYPAVNYTLAVGDSSIDMSRALRSSIWMAYEAGKISEEECFAQAAALYGFQVEDLRAIICDLRQTLTYDVKMLSTFQEIKQTPSVQVVLVSNIADPEFQFLSRRWDGAFLSTFEYILTSRELGVRAPSLRYYEHVLRAIQALPSSTVLIDNEPENVLAGMSLGTRVVLPCVSATKRRETVHYHFFDGHSIDENYAQLLTLEATEDPALVDLIRPPRLWNFFSGKPKFTSQVYPDDMDTTALALGILDYEPVLAHSIIDEMLSYVNEDGLILTYADKTRPRVDEVIAVNVLVALHKHGRYYELPQTMDWVQSILFNRTYIHGTRHYPSSEWFFYYVSRLLTYSKDPSIKEKLEGPLRTRLIERVGTEGDAFCLGMRLLACQSLGIENRVDSERRAGMQMVDGGWEASAMYLFPTEKKTVGYRGTVTAFAVRVLRGAS